MGHHSYFSTDIILGQKAMSSDDVVNTTVVISLKMGSGIWHDVIAL